MTVLAGSLEVDKYFRAYLPQFGDHKKLHRPKLREYPGHFEKYLAYLSFFLLVVETKFKKKL